LGTPRYDEEDEEETVAMAISPSRSEPAHARRSDPSPLPERLESGSHKLEANPNLGVEACGSAREHSVERERGNAIVTRQQVYAGGVYVAARDVPAGSLERRDTLPLTQLLPQSLAGELEPASSVRQPSLSARAEPSSDAAHARSATVERPPLPERSVTAVRPGATERVATGTASHSSIPPIAMLAEPPRNEGSRMGLMIAGASVAALVTVAILNAGTRSAAHGTPVSSARSASSAVAAKPDAGKQETAAPAIAAPAPTPTAEVKPQPPLTVASGKPERAPSAQPAPGSEEERQRELARERRRQQKERLLSERSVQASTEPENPGERTAAIENLLDTRR
jgi:hypothetical protein